MTFIHSSNTSIFSSGCSLFEYVKHCWDQLTLISSSAENQSTRSTLNPYTLKHNISGQKSCLNLYVPSVTENTGESQISYAGLYTNSTWTTDGDEGYIMYLHVQPWSRCMYFNMHMCIHVVPVHSFERRVQVRMHSNILQRKTPSEF